MGIILITTERLILKKLADPEKERLVNLIGDFRVSISLSRVPYPYTMEDAIRWVEIVREQDLNLNIFLNNNLIGGVGLTPSDNDFCELGYWLGVEYWGRGYATEACRGLLHYAETDTSHRRFKADVHTGNFASSNVLEKVGFQQVGKGEVFSLSKDANVPCLNYEYYSR